MCLSAARLWASLKATSMHQCRRFSTDQWARMARLIRLASGARLLMCRRCSTVVLP